MTAHDEAEWLPATLAALARSFPGARVIVADDGSRDATAALARAAGAEVVSAPRRIGKGGTATLGAEALLGEPTRVPRRILLCDGDLGDSAASLAPLVAAVDGGEAELAVAAFARRAGGGFGVVLAAARGVVARATGLRLRAPLSGQRALRGDRLAALLPFAPGFGMETAMAIDAHRAGLRIAEIELPLEHRATGRDPAGFVHRGRQLIDVLRVSVRRAAVSVRRP